MSPEQVIRAWKDEEYRLSLSEEERASLPENPAGFIELADAELDGATGGRYDVKTFVCTQYSVCTCYTIWSCPLRFSL